MDTNNIMLYRHWGHRHVTQEGVAEWLPHLLAEGIFLLFAPDGARGAAIHGAPSLCGGRASSGGKLSRHE